MNKITQTVDLSPNSAIDDSLDNRAGSPSPFARFSPIPILLLLLWLLAACGPSDSGASNADLSAATQRIAQDFQAGGDLAAASAALAGLDVPNANQLLLLETENAINAGDFANADALTRLAFALRLSSSAIERHARSRGLLPAQSQSASQSVSAQPAAQQPIAQATATPVAEIPTATPEAATATPEAPTPTPEAATATPVAEPEVRSDSAMNIRGGPGTNYPLVGALNGGETARIIGKNAAGDWWQIRLAGGTVGWVYGPLVSASGDTAGVAVAEAPPAPPTATPAPAQPTNTPVPAAPAPAGVDFRLIEQRIWGVEENGGRYSGDSINCGDKQELHVIVLDAAGQRLNGVTVRGVYRNEFHVTGEKGPGLAQYDINVDGDDIVVARDVDGRDVTSDQAKGLTAKTYNIPHSYLMQGGFCRDAAGCDAFIKTNGCFGHFSWTVTFQRTY